MRADTELQKITQQFINLYTPYKLLLFGSQAKSTAKPNSDIDICVIKETTNKRELLSDMYMNIESNMPFDLLLYTPDEWAECITDATSFAYVINKEGVVLYARQSKI